MTERGTILYDGSCGACSHFIGDNSTLLKRCGFSTRAVQDEWVTENIDVPQDVLMTDMHLIAADGSIHRGADAYRFIFANISLLYPLYILTNLPLLSGLFDKSYTFVAERRQTFSKICRLDKKRQF